MRCTSPKRPITPTFATSPDGRNEIKSLLTLLGSGLLPLLVLALVMEHLLQLIPSLAQKLASGMGASYATQVGGGFNPTSPATTMPFESSLQDVGAGFDTAFRRSSSANTLGRASDGVGGAVKGLVSGTGVPGGTEGGVTESFARWISNPNRFGL